jgi:hypothetical protein
MLVAPAVVARLKLTDAKPADWRHHRPPPLHDRRSEAVKKCHSSPPLRVGHYTSSRTVGQWADEKRDFCHNMLYLRFSTATIACAACLLFHQSRGGEGGARHRLAACATGQCICGRGGRRDPAGDSRREPAGVYALNPARVDRSLRNRHGRICDCLTPPSPPRIRSLETSCRKQHSQPLDDGGKNLAQRVHCDHRTG